jgi:hypothetical protein
MEIDLYGKKDCKLCADAEKKLQLLRVAYTKYDIEYFGIVHEGWRDDRSVDVMAMHCLVNQQIPMIVVDGKPYNYTGAMRAIKEARKH